MSNSITESAWDLMRDNDYKSVINDKKTLWWLFGECMKKAWSNFSKAILALVVPEQNKTNFRPLMPIEQARLQYVYQADSSGLLVDLQAGRVFCSCLDKVRKLFDEACVKLDKIPITGSFFLDKREHDGVDEILDELMDLPINQ